MPYDMTPIEEYTHNISTSITDAYAMPSVFTHGRVAIELNNIYSELIDPAAVHTTNALGITIGTGDGDERILRFIPWHHVASIYVADPQIEKDRVRARRAAYTARWGSLIPKARLWEELGPDTDAERAALWLVAQFPSPTSALTNQQLADDAHTIADILSDY